MPLAALVVSGHLLITLVAAVPTANAQSRQTPDAAHAAAPALSATATGSETPNEAATPPMVEAPESSAPEDEQAAPVTITSAPRAATLQDREEDLQKPTSGDVFGASLGVGVAVGLVGSVIGVVGGLVAGVILFSGNLFTWPLILLSPIVGGVGVGLLTFVVGWSASAILFSIAGAPARPAAPVDGVAAPRGARNILSVSPLGLLGGYRAVEYERALHSHWSFFVQPQWDNRPLLERAYVGVRVDGGARYFPFGEAPSGFFLQPHLTVAYRRYDSNLGQSARLGAGAMVGYSFVVGWLYASVGFGTSAVSELYFEGSRSSEFPWLWRGNLGVAF